MTFDLTTAPIPVLIRRLAIPAGTGFFFNTMFNVVDTWYGAKLSTTALAAMSLCFPVFFIVLSIGAGVSTGATALIGNALGRGDHEEARQYILQALSFALVNAILLVIAGHAAGPHIFQFMGAEGEYLALAVSYMGVIFSGAPFFMFNFVMSAILNSHGNTATYRNFLITGFFLNMALDPWFMYGGLGLPPLGLPGVALATVVIQCLGNFYLFRYLANSGIIGSFRLHELLPRRHHYLELGRQGFPSALNMMTVSLGIFIITWFVGRYGKDAVAAYGIGTRIEQVALLPVMGLNVSTLALTAQNFGAGHMRRIRETLGISLRYGFTLASFGTCIALLFTPQLMSFFSSDPAVISAGVRFLKIEAFVLPAYVLLYICVSAMQGIQRPVFALWIGLYRQILAPAAVFYLLTSVFNWGIIGVWWGIFAVTWSAALIVVLYVTIILNKLEKDIFVV
ncbi:MATE family efflux transporter [Pelotalea chapellei]|uniref:MATE family efflux transporter n=1 Tax=Pelotalea chapellei TaxID=44671 RepID=A0ABS5U415_9BACT|nr:MATE family efflux transporter [Pelotalea chapellei]MBT1070379.1 MATE family efflux transporter [Pelotalea chapellei]